VTSRVEDLLEAVLASLAELHLRVAELEVDVNQRPRTIILAQPGEPEEMELDDGVDPTTAVGPPRPRLVVDNGGDDGRV
jgi:hypothetical protein